MLTMTVPDRSEAAEYFFTYINQVPEGDIIGILDKQATDHAALLSGISEEKSLYRYEPGKWSIRDVAAHINDTERVFTYRALWFARGFDSPLPSFDQNIAVPHANADDRSMASHVEDFRAVRAATLTLFRYMPQEAWMRKGIASGNPFSVRALAYITAGHCEHHAKVLRQRYLTAK